MVDQFQARSLDSGTSRAFVDFVTLALVIHLAPVGIEKLLKVRSAWVCKNGQPCPFVWP